MYGLCVLFLLVFGVEMLFGLVPFKTCLPLVRIGVCSPFFFSLFLSLSLCCCGDVRRRRFFSFSLSLSLCLSQVLGKAKPLLGFGVPLVFLHPGRGLRLQPVHQARLLPLGHRSALFFLFVLFFRSSFALGCGRFG